MAKRQSIAKPKSFNARQYTGNKGRYSIFEILGREKSRRLLITRRSTCGWAKNFPTLIWSLSPVVVVFDKMVMSSAYKHSFASSSRLANIWFFTTNFSGLNSNARSAHFYDCNATQANFNLRQNGKRYLFSSAMRRAYWSVLAVSYASLQGFFVRQCNWRQATTIEDGSGFIENLTMPSPTNWNSSNTRPIQSHC